VRIAGILTGSRQLALVSVRMARRTSNSSSLNPHASVFVPVLRRDVHSPGYQQPVLQIPGAQPAFAPTGPDAFEQLPDEVHYTAMQSKAERSHTMYVPTV
jgi:hypothetical protein